MCTSLLFILTEIPTGDNAFTGIKFFFFFFFRCLFQDGKAMQDLLATLWCNISSAKNKAAGLWSVNISSLNFGWVAEYCE